jgi:uncharacterized damage-inducible protein DinB
MNEELDTNIYTQKIEKITQWFLNEFGNLSEEELNWKSEKNRWSIAQILEHVITVNESYYPIFDELVAGSYRTPFFGKLPFMHSFFGNLILKYVQPDRRKKTKTISRWEPSYSRIRNDILNRFRTHQKELLKRIKSLANVAGKDTIINSPAGRNVVYSLDKAIAIIIAHEERHLNQAREMWKIRNG